MTSEKRKNPEFDDNRPPRFRDRDGLIFLVGRADEHPDRDDDGGSSVMAPHRGPKRPSPLAARARPPRTRDGH